jgi:hypothetical protein
MLTEGSLQSIVDGGKHTVELSSEYRQRGMSQLAWLEASLDALISQDDQQDQAHLLG